MRNPAVAHIYGHGKSRSKPLRRKSIKNIIIQHKGHQKLMNLLDAIIKKTAAPVKVHMKKSRFAVKQAIRNMVSKAAIKPAKPVAKKPVRKFILPKKV